LENLTEHVGPTLRSVSRQAGKPVPNNYCWTLPPRGTGVQPTLYPYLGIDGAGRVRLAADVLVAPHHGSVVEHDTAALLRAVDPQVIVVSSATARPRFAELVRATLGPDCRILVTREAGAVTVRITPSGDVLVESLRADAERATPRDD